MFDFINGINGDVIANDRKWLENWLNWDSTRN